MILAVSYRAELLEKEMKEQEKRVSNVWLVVSVWGEGLVKEEGGTI